MKTTKWIISLFASIVIVLAGANWTAIEKTHNLENDFSAHKAAQVEREKIILERLEEMRLDLKETKKMVGDIYRRR